MGGSGYIYPFFKISHFFIADWLIGEPVRTLQLGWLNELESLVA
jgi:hypothetical protein